MSGCTMTAVELDAYAGGDVTDAEAFAMEAHVVGCELCQTMLAPRARELRLDAIWDAVEDQLDTPRPGPTEAGLRRVGVPAHLARLLSATPSLTGPWLAAVALTLAFAAAAAQYGRNGLLLFLTVAALLPLASVGVSFGPLLDPTHELGVAAPMSLVRLGLLRTCTVLAVTITLAAAAALTLPGVGWLAAAWLLPALGLTGCSLALATFISAERAVFVVGAAWVGGAVLAVAAPVERLVAFGLPAQACFLVVGLGSVLLAARRSDRLDPAAAR
jgi:hypothetical protein